MIAPIPPSEGNGTRNAREPEPEPERRLVKGWKRPLARVRGEAVPLLRRLKVFCCPANRPRQASARSFKRAAENLFMSQPSLSYQIRALEDEVGFRLFDRSGRGAALTPAGAQFVAILQSIRANLRGRTLMVGGSSPRNRPRGDYAPSRGMVARYPTTTWRYAPGHPARRTR